MHVPEFTLHAKPDHFDELANMYSQLAGPSERVELRLLHQYPG
jgi:hypothetical protein